jgi:hypothetical protein
MVQVDVFWSYGIGAGFALAAANQLRRPTRQALRPASQPARPGRPATRPDAAPDPYLLATVLYAAALFAPSGAWLLWGFTSWETMHAGSYDTVPAWLVALFAATNTTQAALGYLVTRALLRRGRLRLAYLQLVAAYFGMFFILVHGWDGTGYQRFFSPTRADFERWGTDSALAHVQAWVTSDVALTLAGMGVVLIPVLLGLMARWHRAGLGDALGRPAGPAAGWAITGTVLLTIWGLALGGAIATSVLIHALGWIPGALAAIALAVATTAPRRGIADRLSHRFVPDGSARQAVPA